MTRQPKILNTTGAAERLGVTINWIHKLVEHDKLIAYTYNEQGQMVKRPPGTKRQRGRGLVFLEADVRAYKDHKRQAGRPYGARDKKKRVLKAALELAQEEPENT